MPLDREAISASSLLINFYIKDVCRAHDNSLKLRNSIVIKTIRNTKRSRKGPVRSPVLVVAATRVKRGISSLIDLAAGPLPITISKKKSSIAGYKISSTW